MRKNRFELLTDAVASLTAAVTELRSANAEAQTANAKLWTANQELAEEVRELRAGVQVLMDMLGDAGMEITEEQLRREKDFTDGLNAIMNFDFGRPAE